MKVPVFIPTTKKEMEENGWEQLDIILITGDSYIDSPFIGAALIGKLLLQHGYRVGIIAQPDTLSPRDITRLGEPALFWGITGGSVDSMVANYTASKKPRKKDDYTPGGINNRRPDRAVIVYANLIRQYFKNTVPIVLGGIEASLRRISHYDAWANTIRRSILFDAKADYLVYGMAEKAITALSAALAARTTPVDIAGLCYISDTCPQNGTMLPSFEECKKTKAAFTGMFRAFYENNDPVSAKRLVQPHGTRFLIHNPPQPSLTTVELDRLHELHFERELHPFYKKEGDVRALETIRFAIATHRGCYGECNFCAIAVHQGRTVQSRSEESIISEAHKCSSHPRFKGIIADVGGPTGNVYAFECLKKLTKGSCTDKRCLFPSRCPSLPVDHGPQIRLLQKLRKLPGIKKIFVASGIRYDLILADRKNGRKYLQELLRHHISGQMKIAPEHCNEKVLQHMGKPGLQTLRDFRSLFFSLTKKEKHKLFLTYYMIAAHPGCSGKEMKELLLFAKKELQIIPRQTQLFTPTPSTWSTLMYWTGKNPWTGKECFVERNGNKKENQKKILTDAIKKTSKQKTGKRGWKKR